MSSRNQLPPLQSGLRVAVFGAGTMGCDILTHLAQRVMRFRRGSVIGIESKPEVITSATKRFANSVSGAKERKKVDPALADQLIARAGDFFVSRLPPQYRPHLIIEAIPDKLELKRNLFRELDSLCPAETVFATNTSYLSIQEITEVLTPARSKRSVGVHFFWPAHIIRAVEVAVLPETDPAVAAWTVQLIRDLDKEPLITAPRCGLALNVVLSALFVAACKAVEAGLGSEAQIDRICKELAGIEPFRLANGNRSNEIKREGYPYLARDISPWFAPPQLLLNRGNEKWKVGEEEADLNGVDVQTVRKLLAGAFFWTLAELKSSAIVDPQDLAQMLPVVFKMRPPREIEDQFTGSGGVSDCVDWLLGSQFGRDLSAISYHE